MVYILKKFNELFLDRPILNQEGLDQLVGSTITIEYRPPSFGIDSDQDIIEFDALVVVTISSRKYIGVIEMTKPILKNNAVFTGNVAVIKITAATYQKPVTVVPGLLWGTREVHYHQYTFFSDSGDMYTISTPLYYYY